MTRFLSRFLLLLGLGVVLNLPPLCAQQPTPSLLGRWHGSSICTKASWNASCNDEENFFEFVPAAGGLPGILSHGAKRVGTTIQSMGDVELQPDTGRGRWVGEFATTRFHIRIVFQVSDSGLTGAVIQLPALQVARTYRAQRDSTWVPPAW